MTRGGVRPNSGRKKGMGISQEVCDKYQDLILDSKPLEFLINAFKTGVVETKFQGLLKHQYLTYKDRCDIAEKLLRKVIPDLKAIDHKVDKDSNVNYIISAIPLSAAEWAKKHDKTDVN